MEVSDTKIEYSSPSTPSRRWWRHWKWLTALAIALLAYVGAYHFAMGHRTPWANLRYFSWNDDDRIDHALYYVFSPAQVVNHWWDQDTAIHWRNQKENTPGDGP